MSRRASGSSPPTSVRVIQPGDHSPCSPLRVELEEDGVRIALTIVDTPGFGDNIDNEFAYVARATQIETLRRSRALS